MSDINNNGIKKVDFLDSYERTLVAMKEQIGNNRVIKISVSSSNNEEPLEFQSFQDLLEQFKPSDYEKANSISILYLKEDNTMGIVRTDKEKASLIQINDVPKKNDNDSSMFQERLQKAKSLVKDDGCTYYMFKNNGIVGKYDPNTASYYVLNSDNNWEISGVIMRWVLDPSYDYVILTPSEDYQYLGK